MRVRSRSETDETLAEINITPLTDILLVLLIIVMVTANFISKTGVSINLPKSSQKTELPIAPVELTINQQGEVFIDNQRVTWEDLPAYLKALVEKGKGERIIIRGDMKSAYQDVFRSIDVAKAAGFGSIVLGAERKGR